MNKEKLIKKYQGILSILRENQANKTPDDDYPYEADVGLVHGFILCLTSFGDGELSQNQKDALIDSAKGIVRDLKKVC